MLYLMPIFCLKSALASAQSLSNCVLPAFPKKGSEGMNSNMSVHVLLSCEGRTSPDENSDAIAIMGQCGHVAVTRANSPVTISHRPFFDVQYNDIRPAKNRITIWRLQLISTMSPDYAWTGKLPRIEKNFQASNI
jgi:hypothetical protein